MNNLLTETAITTISDNLHIIGKKLYQTAFENINN